MALEENSELEQIIERRLAEVRARNQTRQPVAEQPLMETPQWVPPEEYAPSYGYEPEYMPEVPMPRMATQMPPTGIPPAASPQLATSSAKPSWLKNVEYWNPLSLALRGAEQTSEMLGANITYPFRTPPSEWQKGPFGQAGMEKYREWKGGPEEPYTPLGIPSWSQWGEMVGKTPSQPGYQMAKMGMGDIAETAPLMLLGGGGARALRAGEMITPKIAPKIIGAVTPQGLKAVETMWAKSGVKPAKSWSEVELKIQENINDTYIGLRRMQTKAAKATPIEKGAERDLITMITRAPGMANAGATRYALAMADIKGVAPNVAPKDINTFLWAQHGKEVLAEKGVGRVLSGGIKTDAELSGILTELQTKVGAQGWKQIGDASKIVQNIYKEERARLVNAGFITPEQAALWEKMYPWYNPLRYAKYAETQVAGGKTVAPFTRTKKGIYALSEKGTAETARPPLEVLGEQLVENEVRIGGNEIAKAITKLAQEAGESVTKVRGIRPVVRIPSEAGGEALETIFRRTGGSVPGTLSFYENGTRQIYKVPDWIYREAVVLSQAVRNPVSSLIGAVNGISRAAFTSFSPPFVVSNMLNDMLTAFLARGVMPHESGMRLIASLRGLEKDAVMQSFRLSGGYQVRFFGRGAGELTKEVTASGGKIWKKALKLIPAAGEAGEQAPRMALFKRELNRNLPNWTKMTAEEIARTPQARKAAADAVELTINFGRGGYFIKAANPFIIFLNASMEGVKLPFRALRANPMARLRLAGVGAGTVGLANYNLSFPEYFDIPNSVRWSSAIVMLPSKEKDSRGYPKPNYLCVVPRTREWGLFLAPITYAMEKLYKDNPTDFGTFAKTMAPQLSPIAEFPIPAVAAEFAGQGANWDFYWSEPIVPSELQALPTSEQITPWTSRTLAEIGSKVGVSPVRLQHFTSSILGGAGRAATSVTDYILDLANPVKYEQKITDEVKKYKTASSMERIKILSGLTADEQETLYKAIQQPEKGIPIITPVIKRLLPERGGQLYRTGQALAEKELGINIRQTEETSNILRKVNKSLEEQQREYDTAFQDGKLTGVQWRELHSDLGKQYQGALKTLGVIAPNAAQIKGGISWRNYWDILYTLAGTIPDMRTKGELLYSAYRAIQPQEISLGIMDWETFYRLRDSFIEGLSDEDKALLDTQITARMTPVEQEYYKAQNLLRPYWEVREQVEQIYGKPLTPSREARLNRIIGKIRKRMRMTSPEIATYYALFYQR